MDIPVAFREFQAGDISFVDSAWVNGAAHLAERAGMHRHGYRDIRDRVRKVMEHPSTRILMAANPESPSHLFGFVAYAAPNVLHWVYVARMWRGLGVARAMVSRVVPRFGTDVTICTSRTLEWDKRSKANALLYAEAYSGGV